MILLVSTVGFELSPYPSSEDTDINRTLLLLAADLTEQAKEVTDNPPEVHINLKTAKDSLSTPSLLKMTLDNDTGHFHPSPPRKSYNPFDSDDDTNVFTEQDQIGFDLKPLNEGADALSNGDLSWEEAVFGQPASFENGQLYTDKNVTECELPEILVCYRENNYQSVKDIVIDEGMPVHDKIWVSDSKDEVKDSSSLLDLIRESDDAMKTEKSCLDLSDEVVNGNFIKITELKLEDLADCNTSKIETAEMDPKKNNFNQPGDSDLIGKDGSEHDDTVLKEDEVDSVVVEEPNSGEISQELSTEHREATAKLNKSPNEEDALPKTSENEAVEESANTIKLESGNPESESEHIELEKPPIYQSMTRQEEATSTNSTVSILEPRFHGETSFSSITFTGPVSYSGNISLRSESSAGSTRSFAFPILQTEWNSSPERMVKADQRLVRKQKGGWVQALVCCRF